MKRRPSFVPVDECSQALTGDETSQVSLPIHVEYDDGQRRFTAEREGRHVHHSQVSPNGFDAMNFFEEARGCVFLRIGREYPTHARTFQKHVGFDLQCSQGGGGVRRKVGVARSGTEDHDTALLQMADGAPANERLSNLLHLDAGLQSRVYPALLE